MKALFKPGEVAKLCAVTRKTVCNWLDRGRFPGSYRVSGSLQRRIPRDVLLAFMSKNDIPLDAIKTLDAVTSGYKSRILDRYRRRAAERRQPPVRC